MIQRLDIAIQIYNAGLMLSIIVKDDGLPAIIYYYTIYTKLKLAGFVRNSLFFYIKIFLLQSYTALIAYV